MQHRLLISQVVALSAAILVATALVSADDDHLVIRSVVPAFATPPNAPTLLISGSGFRPRSSKVPQPAVFLGGADGTSRRLAVLQFSDASITAQLDSVSPGTWTLFVSRAGDDKRDEHSAEVDTFSLTLGFVGPQGPQGPVGAKGMTGAMGLRGPTGETGAQGPQGAQGIAGVGGNTGSRGPIGPTGAVGADGPRGAQGVRGPVGPTGATGATGATGH